jgi:hypothetical protein
MKSRAQIFTLDVVLGGVLFLVALVTVLYLWDTTITNIQNSEDAYEMDSLASSAAERLVRTPGTPYNWTRDDVQVYGLVDARSVFGSVRQEDRVIDPDKLLEFVWMTKNKYQSVRSNLIGVGKYHFYLEISCLNESQTDCFNGLHLDRVNYDVKCSNDFAFTVDVAKGMTDSHVWVEGEDAFGNPVSTYCSKDACSGGNVSGVTGEVSAVLATTPGFNKVWVRAYDDESDFTVTVDGFPSVDVASSEAHKLKWFSVGVYELGAATTLKVASSFKLVDAVLVTTNMGYNPNVHNPPYGNPRREYRCIVGFYEGSKGFIVKSDKSAIFSKRQVDSAESNETFRLRVVLWSEIPSAITSSSSSTTMPSSALDCSDPALPLENMCTEFRSVRAISDINIQGSLVCNQSSTVEVDWYGAHNGDANYWGFFLRNPLGGYFYLDSCTSINPFEETQNVSYVMTCSLMMPDLSLLDGEYNLTVTGEDGAPDAGGYCLPGEEYVDAEMSRSVQLTGCRSYADKACIGPVPGPRPQSLCSNASVHSLDIDAPENIGCNGLVAVDVFWSGYHGDHVDDNYTYFGFFLDGSGITIGSCKSESGNDADPSYYRMSCNVNIPNGVAGSHDLIVTANDRYGFCDTTSNIQARDTVDISCGFTSTTTTTTTLLDASPPDIQNADIQPTSGLPGSIFTINADITDPSGVNPATTIAHIQHPNEVDIALVMLYDNGMHNDGAAGDGTYGGSWDSTGFPMGPYYVDITACDFAGNCREAEDI